MLDEKTVRKPDLDEMTSAPVVLGDGQEWLLPKPWLEIRPVFRRGRIADTVPTLTCGPEFDSLKNAVHEAAGENVIAAAADLTAFMLLKNYDLADEQLGPVLTFREGNTWVRDVMRHANGDNAPKAGSAGSD
jgi:hypothetical protein